jgi:AP-1 complex subunit gamma-1|tara:strand:- start:146 stop:403 length:258 start_codon:yes stop_codon:yes gene_type:complete
MGIQADMGRVLATDVARQVGSPTPYVRKKAALALIRILKRSPELSGVYVDGALGLLKDRSHGVLISATQLVATVSFLLTGLTQQV